jgi:retinol dehydrogenase-12
LITFRYNVSKLLEVFSVRELAGLLDASGKQEIVLDAVNPGWCHSELMREMDSKVISLLKRIMCRTTEVGSRTLVSGAGAGRESHGQYMSNCHPTP